MEPFPPLEPYDQGLLDVGDDNLVYWETCGNPSGSRPSSCTVGPAPAAAREAAATSTPSDTASSCSTSVAAAAALPHASDPAADMCGNTTHHLLADMERLREHLGIERWLLYGGSWGSTLILAYAERYPERVSEVVLLGVTMTRRSDIDWLYRGVGRFFPADWDRFRRGVPRGGPGRRPRRRVRAADGEPGRRRPRTGGVRLARVGGRRDFAGAERLAGGLQRPAARRRARVRPHLHALLLARRLARGRRAAARRGRLAGIPGVLLHGRLDLGSPVGTAWELAQAWPGCELVVVDDSGHTGSDTMRELALEATARFSGRR